jgi:hypothetical protein
MAKIIIEFDPNGNLKTLSCLSKGELKTYIDFLNEVLNELP